MSETEDQELLAKFRNSATRNYAFNLIVRKYQQKLYWNIRRMVQDHDDSNDILQNVFIKVWKHLDGFKENSQLYTWLYRISTNETLTFLKQKKTGVFVAYHKVEYQLSNSIESDAYLKSDDIQKLLLDAILILPAKQRLVFNMKYYEELKYEEISQILGTSVGALKASYHHAVKKIEDYITSH